MQWGTVRVAWVDDVSAFVTIGCESPSHTEGVDGNVKQLTASEIEQICDKKGPYKVMLYSAFHNKQQGERDTQVV